MIVDYLIIGQGVAGTVLAFSLLAKGKKIQIVDAGHQYGSSMVAAGIVNPITGRRLVKTWEADRILPIARDFYSELEEKLHTSFYHERSIVRIFENIQQENDFYSKSGESKYEHYLTEKGTTLNDCFKKDFGYGFVNNAAQLMTETFLKKSRSYFIEKKLLIEDSFNPDYKDIQDSSKVSIKGKTINFDKILFCEGAGVMNNSLFNDLPFTPAKGVFALLKSDKFNSNLLIKKGLMIAPTEEKGLYWAGATYDHHNLSLEITEKDKDYIKTKLEKIIREETSSKGYEVMDFGVGIRPTTKDRRPIIGIHPAYDKMVLFNGMGSKGVSLAPWLANELILHLEENKDLPEEVDLRRF